MHKNDTSNKLIYCSFVTDNNIKKKSKSFLTWKKRRKNTKQCLIHSSM